MDQMIEVPEEFLAFLGKSHPAPIGSWIRTDNGTWYRVCGSAIPTTRKVYVYDVPVDRRTACTEAEWRQKCRSVES